MLRRVLYQAEGGIRDELVTGVQTCALPISRGRPVCFQRVVGCGGPDSRVRVSPRGAKRGITRARVVRQRPRVAGYQGGGGWRWIRRAVYEIALQRGGYVLQVALRGRHLRLRARPQEVRDQDRRQDRDDRHNDQQLNERESTLVVEPAQKELKHSLSPFLCLR